jgi:hypothetical protein
MRTKSRSDLVFFLATLIGLAIIFACSQESFSDEDYQDPKSIFEPDELKLEIHLKDESMAAPYKKPSSSPQKMSMTSSFASSQVAAPMSHSYGGVPANNISLTVAIPPYDYDYLMAPPYGGMTSQSYSRIPSYDMVTLRDPATQDYSMSQSYDEALAHDMALAGAIPPNDYSAAWPAPGWPWTWPWFYWTWHQAPWYGVGYPFCDDDLDDNHDRDDDDSDNDNNKNNVVASKNQVYNPLCNKDSKKADSKK